eukprot:TRINITY_DN3029_c0_g1_i1.p2 TRINITY_DN3029_c0_g1~~TRINITY_DN3029_c0_g1_i1.p2  ORF type:complete len:434 (+),score=99.51 TRINITY_DN3029_c0_g1_i1:204-1505(+)
MDSDDEFDDKFAADAARVESNAALTTSSNQQAAGQIQAAYQTLLFVVRKYAGATPTQVLLNCAALGVQLNDRQEAEKCYNFLLKKDPNNYQVLWLRATLFANQPEEYIKHLNIISQKFPRDTTAKFNRAILKLREQDYKSALSDLNDVLSVEPGNAAALGHLGLIYMQLGQFHEAEQKLQHSIKMQPNPSYQDALKVVAEVNVLDKNLKDGTFQAELDVLKLKKDWKGVVEFLDRYLARFMGNDMLWCQKGQALGELDDFVGAFHCLSRAITINKNSEAVSLMKKLQDRHELLQTKKFEDDKKELKKLQQLKEEEVANLKKQNGIDLLEQSLKIAKDKREGIKQKLKATNNLFDPSRRLKYLASGQMHVISVGSASTKSRIASLLKVDPAALLSVDVAAHGDVDRQTLTIDELVSDGVKLPQPRPLIVGHKLK